MTSKKRIVGIVIAAIVVVAGAGVLLLLPKADKNMGTSETGDNANSGKSAEEVSLAINPCTLLSDSERGGLGLESGEENDRRDKGVLAYRACDWRSGTLQVGATIFPSGSLKTSQGWQGVIPEALTVGSHKAQIAQAPLDRTAELVGSRACQLDIQLDISGGASRVRLLVYIRNDTSTRSCDVARQVADFMAPRLPE